MNAIKASLFPRRFWGGAMLLVCVGLLQQPSYAQGIESLLGGAIKGGLTSAISKGDAGTGALVGAGFELFEGAMENNQQGRQQQQYSEELRRAYERGRIDAQKEAYWQPRDHEGRSQTARSSGSVSDGDVDLFESPQAWDERARLDIQKMENRYGIEAGMSLRKRIAELQRIRDHRE